MHFSNFLFFFFLELLKYSSSFDIEILNEKQMKTFSLLQAGGDITGKFNQILSQYGVPAVVFIIVLSGVAGVLINLDKIMDSDGRGTRKEGILNVVYIMGGVVLAVAIISAVVTVAKGVKLSV